MHLIIRNLNGRLSEAVVLAAGSRRMRLAVRGVADAVEYTLLYGQWLSETDEPIELDSLVLDGKIEADTICSLLAPRAHAAHRSEA